MADILVIPDVHCDPHYSNERLDWAGRYAAEVLNDGDIVVQLGDFGEFRAFSSYDHGTSAHVEESYDRDFESVDDGWARLRKSSKGKKLRWFLTEGNHEARVYKALASDHRLAGSIDPDQRFPWRRDPQVTWARYGIPVRVQGISFVHALLLNSGRAQRSKSGPARAAMMEFHDSIVVGHSHIHDMHLGTQARSRRLFSMHGGHFSHPAHTKEAWCEATSPEWWAGVTVLHGVRKGFPHGGISMEPYENLRRWYR